VWSARRGAKRPSLSSGRSAEQLQRDPVFFRALRLGFIPDLKCDRKSLILRGGQISPLDDPPQAGAKLASIPIAPGQAWRRGMDEVAIT
jgi:hypothetical protein